MKKKQFTARLKKITGPPKAKKTTLRAVIYARVSSREQAEKMFSIPDIQIPECKKLIKESGWRYVKTYKDEGYDGNTFLKRPDLQDMLVQEINIYDIAVMWSFDRLVRDDSSVEAKIYNALDRHKKQATSVLQRTTIVDSIEYDPKNLDVVTHRKFRSIQISYDSLVRRKRFMESREKTVRRGRHIVTAPFGYRVIREIDPKDPRRNRGYKAPDKKETPTLKRIFKERVLENKSYRSIACGLNEDRIKTRSGAEWSGPRIRQVLINPFPAGYILWNKTRDRKHGDERIRESIPEPKWELIPVDQKEEKHYKPLISEEWYLKAQEMRQISSEIGSRGSTSLNILAGLAECPLCGASMVETRGYKVKKPPHWRRYLVCSRYMNKRLCSSQGYPSYPIKKKVVRKVKSFLDNPKAFQVYLKRTDKKRLREIENQIKSREQSLKQVQNRIESLNLKYLDNKIKESYYSDLLPKLEEEENQEKTIINSLKRDLESYNHQNKNRSSLEALSEEIKDRFKNLNDRQLKIIVRALIEKITFVKSEISPQVIPLSPAIIERGCSFQKQQQYDGCR